MSGAPICSKNFGINPFSVIPNTQPKLPVVIVDFNFDLLRLRMPKCIPQRLACNPINFVPMDRMEILRCALQLYSNCVRR